ncbi:hypothetical protein Syun_005143 [Stephania yunnanensis]|uniref:Carboxypeptidase n=1 Tax=Stephania yunnanensis TaxID=152371 RepID=A0AAP0L4K3_9MAGN
MACNYVASFFCLFYIAFISTMLAASGDLDSKVPTAATFREVQKMNVKQTRAWRPWIVTQEGGYQTGGYTVEYEQGLTFATVRGAGHEVPEYQLERAFIMFTYFLTGKSLPSLQRHE